MVQITWRLNVKEGLRRIRDGFYRKVSEFGLTVRSLTYNEHMSYNYVIDCLLEPFIWLVDNYAKKLGKVFVFCVIVLTSAVVFIAYWLGLPYWWERDPYTTVFLVIIGNWLMLNITFHYYMGVNTPPGYPPHGTKIEKGAAVCNKCISSKPPRTHHCSVCDRCVLGMDHHCPWMNNCIGFYNARYFYLYMIYVLAGVIFLIIAGLHLAYVVLWLEDTGGISEHPDPDLIGHPLRLNQSGVLVPVDFIVEYDSILSPREHNLPVPTLTEAQKIAADPWKKGAIKFMALICGGVSLSLGVLCVMHYKHISKGESSIETLVNKKLRETSGPSFRHPYDFGKKKNWKLFLGLTHGRTFIRHVLLPSAHKPIGDGITWHTVQNTIDDWP